MPARAVPQPPAIAAFVRIVIKRKVQRKVQTIWLCEGDKDDEDNNVVDDDLYGDVYGWGNDVQI